MPEQETYTLYAPAGDITFIMLDTYEGGKCKSSEVIGFHYGKPDNNSIKRFSGKLKAELYEEEGDCK